MSIALAAIALAAGCEKKPAAAPGTTPAAATNPQSAATPTKAPAPGTAATPAPPAPATPASALPERMAASHILYAYKGAMRARPEVTRTKDEAQKSAEAALGKLKGGAKFEELAAAESDCPSKKRGGSLGVFPARVMHPKFSEAASKLTEGGLSGVVETPFGFHVIRRDKVEEVRASHILYMYKGSMRAPASVTRSKDEAKAAADAVLAKLKGGAKFEELASKESDCPSKNKGGDLGPFGRGMMAPPFEQAAFALRIGDLSGVVETSFGFHVIKRTN
jgi:parvulin-like peptidyl-prolyl isomerase